jgi:hypothetical protein
VADDFAMALGREGERDDALTDLRGRCARPRTVSQGVTVHVQSPSDNPIRRLGRVPGDVALRTGGRQGKESGRY